MTTTAKQNFALSEAEFRQISDVVHRYSGINLHEGKKDLVRARVAKQLRVRGFQSAAEQLQRIHADRSGRELCLLIDAVSTNVTSFFREVEHFEHLRAEFLPRILEQKRRERRLRLRGWSAGCSSGEEPYSIAMVLN